MRTKDETLEAILFLSDKKGLSDREVAERLNVTERYIRDMMLPIRRERGEAPDRTRVVAAVKNAALRDRTMDTFTFADRDPCFRCGVRKDRHDDAGCGRFRSFKT